MTEEQIKEYYNLLLYTDDKGKKAENFLLNIAPVEKQDQIMKLKFLRFIKDCPIKDKPSRVFGEFKALVGRVLKQYDSATHDIKPFDVPTDWPVQAHIDHHLNREIAIGYYAVDKLGQNYVIEETWEHLSPEETADDIIRKKIKYGWNLRVASIDPLSKGDNKYIKNRASNIEDSFTIISRKLKEHKIVLKVGSKDKESGVKNLETWLEGVNGRPTLFFFIGKTDQHKFELLRWVYDEDGKPKKENDHFMENLYRYSLTGPKYIAPRTKKPKRPKPACSATGW